MNSDSSKEKSKPNRLINEKSPYLQEHAYNPVDWYPWGKEAFDKSAKEDKPIFLSIGYSSCHWCHVFRRESLEDPAVAKILNENFVSIKVDREERPDVDEIYMKALMSMMGSGGWPLNMFLTPTLEPFYGGTYFPPTSRGGIPGFSMLLKSILRAWKSEKDKIVRSAKEVSQALAEQYATDGSQDSLLGESLLDQCFNELGAIYDASYGGFGSAPKFPSPSNIFFLLRYHRKTSQKAPLLMVKKTLDNMARGGIYDHVGGGFHRYSTDREWLVPHFEKMLYDNALLSLAYCEAYLLTKESSYEKTVKQTLSWVLREMTDERGGFFSAQDADSPEGEGAYYLWSIAELGNALANSKKLGGGSSAVLEKNTKILAKYFGITKESNYPESGKTILTSSKDREESLMKEFSLDLGMLLEIIDMGKEAMREYRKLERAAPALDDKILVSWNGLMISALSKAYQAFGETEFLSGAKKSANFILGYLTTDACNKRLVHRYREGEAKESGTLEDYAYFLNGLIDLYESDFDSSYLSKAIDLANEAIRLFYDEKSGGFFLTEKNEKFLIARPKEAYDGAIPSANSVISLALFRLAELTMNEDFEKRAKGTLGAFSGRIERHPSAFAFMLTALYFQTSSPMEIVISGLKGSIDLSQIFKVIHSTFVPNSVVLLASDDVKGISPLAEGRIAKEGQPTRVFVCRGNTCQLPTTSREDVLKILNE